MKVWWDGDDWVVAKDEADATAAWEEHVGEKRDPEAESWSEWTQTARFNMDDELGPRQMTPSQIVAYGRGFFASINY